ncbi:MAG: GNAT family N-acetyltransferase [Sterolibacterium sp.]|nr:GNAT family N-acetyltransferase [Sterolibacterium sp.]MBP9798553.1 GNAT family N-acetyltransferase [Sterolibacterium sp.]
MHEPHEPHDSHEPHEYRHALWPLMEPASIALIGASEREGSLGALLTRNMLETDYRGALYLVNPRHHKLFQRLCHARVEELPARIDLAVLCTPPRTLPELVEACGKRGVRCLLIVSGSTHHARHHALSSRLQAIARHYRMRLLGPASAGLMRPVKGIHLAMNQSQILPGHTALVSQSATLCAAALDWAQSQHAGHSSVITLPTLPTLPPEGSNVSGEIALGEVLDYLATDPQTHSIFLYLEHLGNSQNSQDARHARHFVSALRSAARCKPVLLIKAGRHKAGERATRQYSDTPLAADNITHNIADDVFDAALRRTGAVRLDSIGQMHATLQALATRFRPRGQRLAIITDSGGLGVMAADHADRLGVPLAHNTENPLLDLGDHATTAQYTAALGQMQNDLHVDGILLILTPMPQRDPSGTARRIIEQARQSDKPVITCWMGESQVSEARLLFRAAGIPTFRTPEPAVELFHALGRYFHHQRLLLQIPAAHPASAPEIPPHQLAAARQIIDTALAAGQRQLDEVTSRHLLDSCGLLLHPPPEAPPCPPPSPAYSLSLQRDPLFGPLLLLAAGDESRRRAVALPPLDAVLADDLLQAPTLASQLSQLPENQRTFLRNLLLRLSTLACELPCLHQLTLLLSLPSTGQDTLLIHPLPPICIAPLPAAAAPYDHMAIHPYPAHRITTFHGRDGSPSQAAITIRPIRPTDAALEQEFVRHLSAQSRRYRFMNALCEHPPAQLARLTQIDYDREMAYIATLPDPPDGGGGEVQIGAARYALNPDGHTCEFAIAILDDWQGSGLAQRMMQILIDTARADPRLDTLYGDFLNDNARMIRFVSRLGFTLSPHPEEAGLKRGTLNLS